MPANNSGIVEIHGKQYETVALRVKKFREQFPGHALQTKIVRLDQDEVVMEAQVMNADGRIVANGHAQEFRESSQINRTSYVENCETSALGRALATFGLGGTEFASADEVAHAITGKAAPSGASGAAHCKDTFEAMSEDEQKFLQTIAADVIALLDEGRDVEAHSHLEAQKLDNDEKTAIWSLFGSKQRSALKKAGASKKPYVDEKAAA